MKKRILSLVLCLVMVFSLLPAAALADDLTPEDTTGDGLVLSKDLVPQEDGSYDLQLEAYATGMAEDGQEQRNTEFDIALVIDQSGSMATTDIGGSWNAVNDNWTVEKATSGKTYYVLVDGKYYPVKAGTGPLYYKVTNKPYGYQTFGAGHDSTVLDDGISDISAKIHYNVPTKYYVYDSTNNQMHKMYVMTIGVFTAYAAYAYYYPDEANPWKGGVEGQEDIHYFNAGTWSMKLIMKSKDWETHQKYGGTRKWGTISWNYYDSDYSAWKPDTVVSYNGWYDWMDLCMAGKVVVAGRSGATISDWDANRVRYTWFTNGDRFDNDMYLPVSGTTYNHLYYVDDNGNQQPIGTDAIFSGDTVYSGPLYEKIEGDSRLSTLQGALHDFIEAVAQDASTRGVEHNVSMVGFASNKNDNYLNTGLFDGTTFVRYDNITTANYQNAFVKLNDNDNSGNGVNDIIDTNIDALQADGYTYTSYGMAMANQIFANNDNDGGERQRIIVVFTDGEPGRNGYERNIAGEALSDSETAKNVYGAKVYTIGLYTGNVEQQITDFMTEMTSSKQFTKTNVYASATAGSNNYCGDLDPNESYLYTSAAEGKTYGVSAVQNGHPSLGWWSASIPADGDSYVPKATSSDERDYVTQFYNANGSAFYSGNSDDPVANLDYSATYYTASGEPTQYGYRWFNTDGDVVIPKTSATSAGEQFFALSNPVAREEGEYYFPVTDADGIADAFAAITTYIAPVVNIVSATELGASAELKDFLTDKFDVAEPVSVTVQTAIGTQSAAGAAIQWEDPEDSDLTASCTNGVVTLTGFDYKTNFIAYGKPAVENDTEANQGRKVIVTIHGLTPKANASGTIYSNTDASGIYDGNTLKAAFPMPSIDVGTVPTYVIDYSAKMQLATDAKQMKGETSNNGTFDLSNEKVTYQLTTQAQSGTTAVINTAYADVDTALVFGKPEGMDSVAWNQIATVPASSVYYDDDLANVTITSEGHGKASGIDDETVSENAESVDGTFYFTFYGTGVDVYCTTHKDGGYVSAAVFQTSEPNSCKASTRYGSAKTIRNYASVDYYNTPSVSFTGLPAGTYTLMLTANEGVEYKLDGVRVYNPVQTGSAAETALNKTDEGNANYLNLRSVLLNDAGKGVFTVTTTLPDGGATDAEAVSGVLFIDDVDKVVTTSNIDADGNISPTPVQLYQTQYDTYKANGPKNEIYLDGGQAITFQIDTKNVPAGTKVWIGLSAPTSGSGSVSITGKDGNVSVSSVMDMYYDFTVPANGSVTITNLAAKDSGNIIAVTNLKITGIAGLIPTATADNADAVQNAALSLFRPVTLKTVRMAANNGVDPEETVIPEEPAPTAEPDPQPSADPEPTSEPTAPSAEPTNPTPSISGILQQIFSTFVSRLFGGISRLFGN